MDLEFGQMVTHTCSPSTWEVEAKDQEFSVSLCYIRPCLWWGGREREREEIYYVSPPELQVHETSAWPPRTTWLVVIPRVNQ